MDSGIQPEDPREACDVYWGTHGCCFERGHEGDCECECGFGAPYYGTDTRFYGDHVRERGLPEADANKDMHAALLAFDRARARCGDAKETGHGHSLS